MTANPAANPTYWTTAQKVVFRFFMLLFILYVFFSPNGVLLVNDLYNIYVPVLHNIIVWMGKTVLHLPKSVTVFTNGSGDTTYDYLVLLFALILAVAGTLIWSVIDKKQRNYNKLFYWLAVVLRFYVAITMVTYGYVKIIKLQFPAPSPGRLLEPIGNASPMGLAWTYMGYSTGFNYFAGLAELTCGLLLFFRRTATAGAIVGLVVAGNIMAINYCFDVPVKILSTALVAMCLCLIVKDGRRLVNFFFLNQPVPAANLTPPRFNKKWKNITAATLKYLVVAYVLVGYLIGDIQAATMYGDTAKKPPFYGIYNVQTFIRDHDTLPPLTTDSTRWNKLIIGNGGASVRLMNDSIKMFQLKTDTVAHTFTLTTMSNSKGYVFTYTGTKATLQLKGQWQQNPVQIQLSRYDLQNFLLLKRGFHWINEYPLNR
jgi:hypothetical protein